MSALQFLRHSRATARWVLLCFVFSMGVAVAAPAFAAPATAAEICSAAAPAATLAGGLPMGAALHHGAHCILCFPGLAPAPHAATLAVLPVPPRAWSRRPVRHVTWGTMEPTSARDPPALV